MSLFKGNMLSAALKIGSLLHRLNSGFIQFSLAYSTSSLSSFEECIREAVETENFKQIPELLKSWKISCRNSNPIEFLSDFSESRQRHIIDGILQSLIPIRPHCRPQHVYSCLLSYCLQCSNRLPLALAIIQQTLRSGYLPVPPTHLLLSNAWLDQREKFGSASQILSKLHAIGYSPDSGTYNYLILSLCKADKLEEAVTVLHGMSKAGCIPDLDSYGVLIGEMSERRRTTEVIGLMKEMVGMHALQPRQDTLMKAVDAMCLNRDIPRAVQFIEFLESEGVHIGFEPYELVLEGCLKNRQFVLAGKFVVRMTDKGFIPYIRERHSVFEGLLSVGELEFASIVRQRFAELKS